MFYFNTHLAILVVFVYSTHTHSKQGIDGSSIGIYLLYTLVNVGTHIHYTSG